MFLLRRDKYIVSAIFIVDVLLLITSPLSNISLTIPAIQVTGKGPQRPLESKLFPISVYLLPLCASGLIGKGMLAVWRFYSFPFAADGCLRYGNSHRITIDCGIPKK